MIGQSPASTTTSRRFVQLRPSQADLVDAGFVMLTGIAALFEFRTTYAGWTFLLVGGLGLLLGIVIAHLANALRQPVIVLIAMGTAAFFLLGGAIALRDAPGASLLPTFGTLRNLANTSVHGWRDLLTTVPPVDSSGALLVLPYILGLFCGLSAFSLARRLRGPIWPVLATLTILVTTILLGSLTVRGTVPNATVFALASLVWMAVRVQRRYPAASSGTGRATRLSVAAALFAIAALGGYALGPGLPGAGSHDRLALRSYVTPPFTIGNYPSPLAEFRLYAQSQVVGEQTVGLAKANLFTVTGTVPAGTPIRFATLDTYNGTVWAASTGLETDGAKPNSFLRVGSTLDNPAAGPTYGMTVKIDAYDDYWMPSAGAVQSMKFTGSDSVQQAQDVRYNLATGTGVVPGKLSSGSSYSLAVAGVRQASLAAGDALAADGYGSAGVFLKDAAFKLAGGTGSAAEQVLTIGQNLKAIGRYTGGGAGSGFEYYLPGHSIGRLTDFVKGVLPNVLYVGDDEQYAAAYALMIQQLGVPARVVVGVEALPASGVVTGADVDAWVEVQTVDRTWRAIPTTDFLDKNHPPDKQQLQQQTQQDAGSVVPPPAQGRPKSALDDTAQSDGNSRDRTSRNGAGGFALPGWVVATGKYVGIPVLALLAGCALIVGGKVWRRRRRRLRGTPQARLVGGWRELVDHARDLGTGIVPRATRREQAGVLGRFDLLGVARLVDEHVFSARDITPDDAEAVWSEVAGVRARMSSGVGRRRRWLAAINLATFVRRPSGAGR